MTKSLTGYLVRDNNGFAVDNNYKGQCKLFIGDIKPKRAENSYYGKPFIWDDNCSNYGNDAYFETIFIDDDMLPDGCDITWEDEPIKIELFIKKV